MHMVDKQHCSMNENDFEPYEKFYDFQISIKDQALKFQKRFNLPLSSITTKIVKDGVEKEVYFIPKLEKTLTGLKLPDGRIIGHKEYRTFFNQNPRPERPQASPSHVLQLTENGERVPMTANPKSIGAKKYNKRKLM